MTFCAAHCERWLYLLTWDSGLIAVHVKSYHTSRQVNYSILADLERVEKIMYLPRTNKTFLRDMQNATIIVDRNLSTLIRSFLKHFILNTKSSKCNSEQKVVETIVNIMPTDIVNAGPTGFDCSIAHMYCVYNVVFNYHLALCFTMVLNMCVFVLFGIS